jgi:spectinomycin phosphotransferase
MLMKPNIPDEKVIACLAEAFGLCITQLDFLPLGGDLCTAVYRAATQDGSTYFCKLRCSDFDDISVELPKYWSDQGIAQIIPPRVTRTGGLWAAMDAYHVIVYPFIEGASGFELELSEGHWAQFGASLKRIHTTRLPQPLRQKMREDRYTPEWRDICRDVIRRLDQGSFEDPIMAAMAGFLLPRRETVLDMLERAERLALALASRPIEKIPCHTDIHPGNLFLHPSGSLYIIDWDDLVLAPKERDLMFVGGGQGYVNTTAQEEETRFYHYYGEPDIDPVAMAYYRFERNILDISVEATRVFTTTLGEQERAHCLEIITWGFLPESSVEMAFKTGWPL